MRQETIEKLLALEPRMTALQITRLLDPDAQQVLKNGRSYPKTYQGVNDLLRRMTKPSPRRPLAPLKVQGMGIGRADWFMLSSTRKVNKSYLYECAAADLFVAYYPFMSAWSYEPLLGDVRTDRGMRMLSKTFYFEVDLSTENLRIIEDKIKAYIRYGDLTGERFYVVFDIVGKDAAGVNRRTSDIGALLDHYRSENQFSLASHRTLTSSGLEDKVLFSPDGRYSFASM